MTEDSVTVEILKSIRDEAGYAEAHQAYIRAVTRLSVARRVP